MARSYDPDEYRQYIEKDGALERRFQKGDGRADYCRDGDHSEQHQVQVRRSPQCELQRMPSMPVKLSDRYISDRYFDNKAIDVLDEAGPWVHITNIHVPQSILGPWR